MFSTPERHWERKPLMKMGDFDICNKKNQWISPLKEKCNNLNIYTCKNEWYICKLQVYELRFGEAYFEYFESRHFSHENTNIDASVFMIDLRMINMSSECEYDWYWKNISLLERIWSLWLVRFARTPTNFTFWLGRLIFSL